MAIKNIEMQKKNADGSFDIFHPKTKASMVIAEDGSNLESHLAESATQAHLAKNIGLEDTTGNFVATEVEGAMNELFTNVSDGKSLVGGAITGVDDSVVIPTDPTFGYLANAIGGISTGKKWASGSEIPVNRSITKRDLGFKPSLVGMIYSQYDGGFVVRGYFDFKPQNYSITWYDDGFTITTGMAFGQGVEWSWIAFE